jgi:hypothetical protein
MMDAIEFVKIQERRPNAAETKALGLQWHNNALVKALAEANAEIKRLGGMTVPVPQSPLGEVT